jgi:hypothetical protein
MSDQCIALSDTYVAIGSQGQLQVFISDGKFVGRWEYSDNIDEAVINKLCFSADERQLITLLVYGTCNAKEACVYSTERFPNGIWNDLKLLGRLC